MSRIKDGKLKPRTAPKQKTAQRKPGLLFSSLRVEVEDVTARHKAPCGRCTEIPTVRRLKLQQGTGRTGQSDILCRACGDRWLRERRREVARAIKRLATGKGEVRL